MKRATAAVAIAAGLALGGLAYGVQRYFGHETPPAAALWAAGLVDAAGHPADARQFSGRPALIFFGYTHCPDFCPTALAAAGAALSDLGPVAARMRVIFITLDPERDSPEVLHDYLQAFDPRIVGLTGAPDGIRAAARAFGIQFEKQGPAPDYAIDHTAAFVLTDAQGRLAAVLSYDSAPEALAAAMLKVLAARSV